MNTLDLAVAEAVHTLEAAGCNRLEAAVHNLAVAHNQPEVVAHSLVVAHNPTVAVVEAVVVVEAAPAAELLEEQQMRMLAVTAIVLIVEKPPRQHSYRSIDCHPTNEALSYRLKGRGTIQQ